MAYDIIILAGQSNMAGVGTPYGPKTDPEHPKIFQFSQASTIIPATEPLDMPAGAGGIGPGFQFARHYVAAGLNGDRDVLLVPAARGGTPLVTTTEARTWNPNVTGNFYDEQIAHIQGAMAAAGAESRVVTALWLQGEADGERLETRAEYSTVLDQLIAGFRTVTGEPNLPFILGQMVPERLYDGTRHDINLAHWDTPNRDTWAGFVESPNHHHMPGDTNHFNAAGQRIIGARMFDAYQRVSVGLVAPERIIFGDDFNRADGPVTAPAPIGGIGWVKTSSTELTIESATAAVTTGGASAGVAVFDPNSTDGVLRATLSTLGDGHGMLLARYVDSDEFLYLGARSTSEHTWCLHKHGPFSVDTVADFGVAMGSGDELEIRMAGTRVEVDINLVPVFAGDIPDYATNGDRHGLGVLDSSGGLDRWGHVSFTA